MAVCSTPCFCNNNGTSPWDRRIFITCTGWALSRRTDRLDECCLSCAVLDITCEKSLCFLYLTNQYKDIQPPNNIVALQQKFFILSPFTAVSFNATEQGTLRSCLLLFHECSYSLNVILSPHQRQPSVRILEQQRDLFTPELFKPLNDMLHSKSGLA